MPFKKRKAAQEARANEINSSRLQFEKKYDDLLNDAEKITDPAVKVIALWNIQKSIRDLIKTENAAIDKEASKKGKRGYHAGDALAGAGLITGLVVGGPIAWVGAGVVVAGTVGGSVLYSKSRKNAKKKLSEESAAHFKHLNDQITLASVMANRTIVTNVKGISHSPFYGQMLSLPGVSARFAAAAAKHIAVSDETPAEEAGQKKIIKTPKPNN